MRPYSIPGSVRSSVYLPSPVTFARASFIGSGWPITRISGIFSCLPHSVLAGALLQAPGRAQHRLVNLRVPGAPAEIARQRLPDFCQGRRGISCEKGTGGQNEPWSAESTLRAAGFHEGLLDRVQLSVLGQALDGRNLGVLVAGSQRHAGQCRPPVNEHRAAATAGVVASALGAGQAEIFAQHFQQQSVRRDSQFVEMAVDAELNQLLSRASDCAAAASVSCCHRKLLYQPKSAGAL